MYADIIVDISHEQLDKTFQYAVPDRLLQEVDIGVMVYIPFGRGNKLITGYIIEFSDAPKIAVEKIKEIDSVVSGKIQAVGKMIQLAAWLKKHYGSTMNQALKTVIPVKETVRHKEKKYLQLLAAGQELEEALAYLKKRNATAQVRLLEALQEETVLDCEMIRNKLNITMQTVHALTDKKLAKLIIEQEYRNPIAQDKREAKQIVLNQRQQQIVDSFTKDYLAGIRRTYLLHGVTGSGKTICYMEMIEQVVAQGRQVIFLIPEIALTYQTVSRFYHRFGNRVSILHSRMSKGERYDQFLRAMRGEIDIMIGPRSALFTPFSNIGLIVIDEEHENAYKSEQSPRYHAKEVAQYLAKDNQASVILGSATPSVEDYYRARNGEYDLYELPDRAMGNALPTVYTEDLREELKQGNRSILSRKLQELMTDRLAKKEQIMLFLNKRGYAGFISCRSCGAVMKCPHCDISLTAHRNGKLICHYCGYERPQMKLCPKCGSRYISGFRAGTQQVEEIVHKMYPQARILRMDMDTTSGKDGHEKILSAFANHEADILIGTQMIVKGHDFPSVTLVGILAADMSLYAGDYTAPERTFQLLTQAAGRAGRAQRPGEVVIQTYTPEHYSIQTAARQNYQEFYEEEIAYRALMDYPPYKAMLKIQFSSKKPDKLEEMAERFVQEEQQFQNEQIQLFAPINAGVYKINDIYTKIVYAKSESAEKLEILKSRIEEWMQQHRYYANIMLQFDIDE